MNSILMKNKTTTTNKTGHFNFPKNKWNDNLVMNQGKADGISGKFLDAIDNFSSSALSSHSKSHVLYSQ
ncbi:hypothetical protein BpHYR1_015441 [Brachionus plicatilis]|uniref:Uncharacterized protein n=1 Tax=Brachionus plicatilis TaxID=10195 RepID=A0A3M7PRZ9_BRAPC|nr:hypothetical protein BpHYR1_015441 [Brachionus plicatilis]